MAAPARPLVTLFGYDSSAFTQKVRLALRLKRIPYVFVLVPSMMPRPVLRDYFGITYRKIPVLAINRDFYIDTSLIVEALEQRFPASAGYGTIYPGCSTDNTKKKHNYRPLVRGFASYWTDRPLFRVTTGLMPAAVWRSSFGADRADLIGHELDPDKLERKVPRNLSGLDMHLSMLEPMFGGAAKDDNDASGGDNASGGSWVFDTPSPSHADIALYYQLDWAQKLSQGEGMHDLTGGETGENHGEGIGQVFNGHRYPRLWSWFWRMRAYMDGMPAEETRVERSQDSRVRTLVQDIAETQMAPESPLLSCSAAQLRELDERNGLKPGARVVVAPDDTGRAHPSVGSLVALSPEEIVIQPSHAPAEMSLPIGQVRVHFPRLGFVVKPA